MSSKRPLRPRSILILAITALILLAACAQALTLSPSPDPATPSPSASPSATPSPSPTPEPTPDPLNRTLLENRLNVLVVGEDMSAVRRARGYTGDNTDALMLVSVSPGQKRVTMVSLPRDTVDIPLSNGQIWSGKVNGVANTYGLDGLRQALATMWGIEIPYYVKVNMDGFVALVDAVGGITVKVKTIVQEPRWGLYLTPGRAHLDGITALHFSRARYYDSDFARAARQQQLIRALAKKYSDPATDVRLGRLLGTAAGLETNLPLEDLKTLVVMARRASRGSYSSEVLAPPQFALGWGDQHDGRGWVIIPNVNAMRVEIRRLLAD
ncbi:MAG TPA: LCP family protein [Candidatus Limnocylindria bacterium]|jgi:LCP family protein required for cell wall assembly